MYFIGITLYAFIYLRVPFMGNNAYELLNSILKKKLKTINKCFCWI